MVSPPSPSAPHLHVVPIVPQRRQPIVVRIPEVAQQQVDVGAVGAKDGVELRIAALHVQPLAILLNRLAQVELLLMPQARLERIITHVLKACGRGEEGGRWGGSRVRGVKAGQGGDNVGCGRPHDFPQRVCSVTPRAVAK